MARPSKTYIDENGRVCTKCKVYKEWYLFCLDKRNAATGHSTRCSDCLANYKNKMRQTHKSEMYLREYGITQSQYEEMLIDQGNKCKICEIELKLSGTCANSASVDHCHKTQKVRGILCMKCNRGLGCFNDNPDFILKAHRYLTNENS